MAKPSSPRGTFRTRLAAAAIALALVPIAVVGWSLIAVNEAALEDQSRELLLAVIDDVGHSVDATVSQAALGLAAIGNTLADEQASPAAQLALTRALVAALPGVTSVGFYDEAGARFDAARRAGDAAPLPERLPASLLARATAHGRVADEVALAASGAYLPIVQPIRRSAGTWFAYAPIALAPLSARVAELVQTRFAGRLDAVVVIDRQLRMVSHADPEQVGAIATDARWTGIAATPPEQQLVMYASYDTPAGAMVGAVRTLPSTPLAVIAQVARARAFASIPRMRWTVLAVMALAAALAAGVALLLARRVSAPVAQLVAYSGKLAARDFTATADVRTGDELEVLGDAMTDAARQLAASEQAMLAQAQIRADLGRYLPSQLVDKIVRREQSLELGGQRRTVTLLFADVASFTTLTESYPPEVVATILNQLFTILTEIVFRHGGTVDKYIGDCVMAFWNAPDDQPDHAARALAAATDMLRWLEIGNEAWQAAHGVTIRLAIGVNTGEAVVGNFGSKHRMTYTCIGDAVNIAARLESIARPQQILVSRATRDAAPDAADYRPVGAQRLSGRLDPIEVFEVTA